jgi:hypothetical protein
MRRLALALTAVLACMGHNGGCHADKGNPLASPAHALAVVLESDGQLELELVLVSTSSAPPRHIDEAGAVVVEAPDGATWPLEPVGLGRYHAAVDAPYRPGEAYTFRFVLDEPVATAAHVFPGSLAIAAHGYDDAPQAWLTAPPRAGEPAALAWSPAGLHALVEVWNDAGERTASTVDWSDPAIDSERWRAIPQGGELALDAFPAPGAYVLRLCAVELARRDDAPGPAPQHAVDAFGAELGWLSGALAGRCTTLDIAVP